MRSRTTKAGVAVWIVGMGVRLGLFAVGELLGPRQDAAALLLALAVTLLVRSGILVRRAQHVHPVDAPSAAYGIGAAPPSRKERV